MSGLLTLAKLQRENEKLKLQNEKLQADLVFTQEIVRTLANEIKSFLRSEYPRDMVKTGMKKLNRVLKGEPK